jgi:hypothetical protein
MHRDAGNRGLGIVRLDEIDIAFGIGLAEIRNNPLIDAVRIHDDPAFRSLP